MRPTLKDYSDGKDTIETFQMLARSAYSLPFFFFVQYTKIVMMIEPKGSDILIARHLDSFTYNQFLFHI